MLQLQDGTLIYVAVEPVDMRKAIDGLTILVVDILKESPQSGHVFLFRNKSGNKVKALCWNKNGFILHYKRLEKGRFKFPATLTGNSFEITTQQLSWLFAGLDFMLMDEFSELNYSHYY